MKLVIFGVYSTVAEQSIRQDNGTLNKFMAGLQQAARTRLCSCDH